MNISLKQLDALTNIITVFLLVVYSLSGRSDFLDTMRLPLIIGFMLNLFFVFYVLVKQLMEKSPSAGWSVVRAIANAGFIILLL